MILIEPRLQAEITKDLLARKEQGIQEYGFPLSISSINSPLQDAYEEALDCLLYIRQTIEQRHFKQHSKPIVDLIIEETHMSKELEEVYENVLLVVCQLKRFSKAQEENEQISD